MACPRAVLGVLESRRYALLAAATALYILAVLVNAGLIDVLYTLPDYITEPRRAPTPYYLVLSSYSLAPFTSRIDGHALEETLRRLTGVEKVVYEVLALVEYHGTDIVVRGVRGEDLVIVAGSYKVLGRPFDDHCIGCVWPGSALARELGLHRGDVIVVYSPFTCSDYALRVEGVLHASGPLSYELVTNPATAMAIRGLGPGSTSIAIVFLDSLEGFERAVRLLGLPAAEKSMVGRALLALRSHGGGVSASAYESYTSMLLSRVRLSRSLLLALQAAVTLLLGLGFYTLGQSLVLGSSEELELLHELGLPLRSARACITALALAHYAAAGLAAAAAAWRILPGVRLGILHYRVGLVPDASILAASLALGAAMLAAGVWMVKPDGRA